MLVPQICLYKVEWAWSRHRNTRRKKMMWLKKQQSDLKQRNNEGNVMTFMFVSSTHWKKVTVCLSLHTDLISFVISLVEPKLQWISHMLQVCHDLLCYHCTLSHLTFINTPTFLPWQRLNPKPFSWDFIQGELCSNFELTIMFLSNTLDIPSEWYFLPDKTLILDDS